MIGSKASMKEEEYKECNNVGTDYPDSEPGIRGTKMRGTRIPS